MKTKKYVSPEIEITEFETDDVISTSGEKPDTELPEFDPFA